MVDPPISSYLTSSRPSYLHFISFDSISSLSHLISSHLVSSHPISSHLISSYLISSHLTSHISPPSHPMASHGIPSHPISSHLTSISSPSPISSHLSAHLSSLFHRIFSPGLLTLSSRSCHVVVSPGVVSCHLEPTISAAATLSKLHVDPMDGSWFDLI